MKNNKVKILIILLVILVLLIALVYFMTDLFKSPKSLFYKYLINGNLENLTDMDYDKFLETIKSQKPYADSGSIKIKFETNDENNKMVSGALNKINVNYETKIDNNEQNQYIHIRGNYDNSELLNIEMLKNKSIIGLKEQDLNDKYISIDMSKLKETLEKYGISDSKIYNISNENNLYTLYYISKEDRNTIVNNYKEILLNKKYNKNYSVERNVEIDVNGNNYKCNAYKLSMTNQELNELYIELLEKLKTDELTMNLIIEKYNMSNLSNKPLTKELLIKNIQNEIDEISAEKADDGNISVIVYENNSKTIRTEIIKDNNNVCIDITKSNNNLILLIKNNIDNVKSEMLLNINNISETETEYKIIQSKGKEKLKIEIVNKRENNIQTAIETLNKENSNNISEMNDEELQNFNNEISNNFSAYLMKKLNVLGISNEIVSDDNEEDIHSEMTFEEENI